MSFLEKTIISIQNALSDEEAFLHFDQAMLFYGYNNSCYTLMNDHISIQQKAFHGLATTYPEDWLKYYKENNYQNIDVIWKRLLSKPGPFFWNDVIDDIINDDAIAEDTKKNSYKVMEQAREAGVTDGVGISFVNDLGEITGIGLSREFDEPSKSFDDMASIYLIAMTFHDKFIGNFKTFEPPELSNREKDVLQWSAEGKTDWEISEILSISVPTVRFHWKNIFKKLAVNSRTLATTLAIRHKLITPRMINIPYQK